MALSPAAEGLKPVGCEHYKRKSKFVVSKLEMVQSNFARAELFIIFFSYLT